MLLYLVCSCRSNTIFVGLYHDKSNFRDGVVKGTRLITEKKTFERKAFSMNAIDFKDEAAVKEYIDRIGIEFRFQCFSEDRSDGCHRLGDWLEFAKKDWAGAGRIFKLNCDCHQYGHSCFKYGVYNFLGRGLKEANKAEAAKYYREGCYSPNEPYAPVFYARKRCY